MLSRLRCQHPAGCPRSCSFLRVALHGRGADTGRSLLSAIKSAFHVCQMLMRWNFRLCLRFNTALAVWSKCKCIAMPVCSISRTQYSVHGCPAQVVQQASSFPPRSPTTVVAALQPPPPTFIQQVLMHCTASRMLQAWANAPPIHSKRKMPIMNVPRTADVSRECQSLRLCIHCWLTGDCWRPPPDQSAAAGDCRRSAPEAPPAAASDWCSEQLQDVGARAASAVKAQDSSQQPNSSHWLLYVCCCRMPPSEQSATAGVCRRPPPEAPAAVA